jgi:uncharacterized protein YjiS (DUF1127 family)
MNALEEDMKFIGSVSDSPLLESQTFSPFSKMLGAARRWRHNAQIRKSARGLENLDEHLLKDVGLFREHLPSGAIRFRRRDKCGTQSLTVILASRGELTRSANLLSQLIQLLAQRCYRPILRQALLKSSFGFVAPNLLMFVIGYSLAHVRCADL